MVKIKLIRTGRKHRPSYRIAAMNAKSKRGGKAIAYLGYYDPLVDPKVFEVNKEQYDKWLLQGAQPTDTVRDLIKKYTS